MSERLLLPLLVDGASINALVVGGGAVGTRRLRWLLDGGARVCVVSRAMAPELVALARTSERVMLLESEFIPEMLEGVSLVVAATSDRHTNEFIGEAARERGILVVVADAPGSGTCVVPAVHRAGPVVVAVGAGGVPGAAARIRDAIAARIDGRFGTAVAALALLRRSLLDRGERERWQSAASTLVDERFCERIESERLESELAAWR